MKLKCEGDPMSPEEVKRLIEDLHMPLSNELREISRIGLLLFYSMKTIEEIQLLGDVFWRIKNARMTEGNKTVQKIWDTYHQQKEKDPAFKDSRSAVLMNLVQQEIAGLSYINSLCPNITYSKDVKSEIEHMGRIFHDERLIRIGDTYGDKIKKYLAENHLVEIVLEANLYIGAGIGRTINGMTVVGLAEHAFRKENFFIVVTSDNQIIGIPESEANNLIQAIATAIIQQGQNENKNR